MSSEVKVSVEGLKKLKAELESLKGPERQRIAENIREAKSHGDLRENAMYHEAKLNQRRLEARIAELEHVVLNARVVEESTEVGIATLGSTIVLFDLEWEDHMTIVLVGDFEADPLSDKISASSPMGAACMGCAADVEIEVDTPGGIRRYKIVSVE